MKRFIVAAAVVVALGFGHTGKANAQIVFGLSPPNQSGLMTGGGAFMLGGFGNQNMAVSPALRGVVIEPTFGTPFGFSRFNEFNRFDRFNQFNNFGFNRFNGMGFNSSFFRPNTFTQPNAFGNPFGGSNFFMGRGRR